MKALTSNRAAGALECERAALAFLVSSFGAQVSAASERESGSSAAALRKWLRRTSFHTDC